MKKGDNVTLCDGEGMFYEAVLSDFSDKTVVADILSKREAETEPSVKVTVFQGVPKNPKLETIIQKLTEIGAVRLVPVDTKRAVAKLDKENTRVFLVGHSYAGQCAARFAAAVFDMTAAAFPCCHGKVQL